MDLENSIQEIFSKVSLDELQSKLTSLDSKLLDFSNKGDYSSQTYLDTLREHTQTRELIDIINSLSKIRTQLEENKALQEEEELREMAEEERNNLEMEGFELVEKINEIIRKPLENDDKEAILEIRPGVGGVEAALFAETLFKMYLRYTNVLKLKSEIYNLEYNSEGGINEAIFSINKKGAFGLLRFESGVHRVQRVPATENAGRIHTSTASVVVLPKFEANEVKIKAEDIRIDVYRSSGPGGQSVNTTDSAVRITHLPTGIIVTSQNSKSQHRNKELALEILMGKLYKIENDKQNKSTMDIRSDAIKGGDRSVKIRTYNFPQGRITDHRAGKSWFNLDQIVNGDDFQIVIKEVNSALREL